MARRQTRTSYSVDRTRLQRADSSEREQGGKCQSSQTWRRASVSRGERKNASASAIFFVRLRAPQNALARRNHSRELVASSPARTKRALFQDWEGARLRGVHGGVVVVVVGERKRDALLVLLCCVIISNNGPQSGAASRERKMSDNSSPESARKPVRQRRNGKNKRGEIGRMEGGDKTKGKCCTSAGKSRGGRNKGRSRSSTRQTWIS